MVTQKKIQELMNMNVDPDIVYSYSVNSSRIQECDRLMILKDRQSIVYLEGYYIHFRKKGTDMRKMLGIPQM